MKIAILTFHWTYNFGANLQALATVTALRRRGHEVLVLNWRPPNLMRMYEEDIPPSQAAAHEAFCKELLPQSEPCRDEADLIKVCEAWKPALIILGSDAVFRLNLENPKKAKTEDSVYPNPFWMGWTEKLSFPVRLCTLSASAGGTAIHRIRGGIRKAMRADLRRFDLLAVRDWWAWLMVAWAGGRIARISPDPTVVLRDFQIPEPYRLPEALRGKKYFAVSFGGKVAGSSEWLERFKAEANRAGYLVCSVPNPEGVQEFPADVVLDIPLHPLTWYAVITNASGYLGERFHPVTISLFNGIPVVAVDSYSNGLRSLRWTGFRHFSKTYDVCFRAGCASSCFRSSDFFRRISPAVAVKRLLSPSVRKTAAFPDKSVQRFKKILDRMLHPQGVL